MATRSDKTALTGAAALSGNHAVDGHRRRVYLPQRSKFAIALLFASAWMGFSIIVARPWMDDLAAVTHPFVALWVITFIAFVPGFMNAFLIASLLLDHRPPRFAFETYPGVTVLVAAYNEEAVVKSTLRSICAQDYTGEVEVLVINDGSRDGTAAAVRAAIAGLIRPPNITLHLLDYQQNRGKAAALNSGLRAATHELICTVDADSHMRCESLREIVQRMLSDPPGTMAVAGAILVGNARDTLMAGAQEWDYFHGIAAVKRMQSMYNGTLVAQGAFSLYRRQALKAVGGWPDTVGEDIVLTWAMLKKGYRIGYAEDAVVFTDAPTTFRQFMKQRQRWSRGMIEALERHQRLLLKPRMSTMFVWWNMLFLPLDLTFTLAFIPGLIAAAFGYFWIVGPLTLLLLPLSGLCNIIIYVIQSRMFRRQHLRVRRNFAGLAFYLSVYALIMPPICVLGYISELTRQRKHWGTK